MKYLKLFFIFIISLMLCGCVKTTTKSAQHVLNELQTTSRISYPITNNKYLDTMISDYLVNIINKVSNDKINDCSIIYEIAYPFDNITSILFTVYLDNNLSYYAFTFNTVDNKLLNISDILNNTSYGDDFDNFYINENQLVIVNENYNGLITKDYNDYSDQLLLTITKKVAMIEEFKVSVHEFDPKKPMIALTFDDGPHHLYTDKILDILNKYHSVATFFVIGSQVKDHLDIIKKAIDNGNQIGNHTYSHRNLTKLSKEEIINEINKTNQELATLDYTPHVVRPPYGAYNKKVIDASPNALVLWTIDTLDWQSKDTDKIVKIVEEEVSNGSIILFHDMYETTYKAIEILVPKLIKAGYQLVSIDEMIKNCDNKCIKEKE